MTMKELAAEYRTGAETIKERVQILRGELENEPCRTLQLRLRTRIDSLMSIYREMSEAALNLERYYDRGFRLNAKYRI